MQDFDDPRLPVLEGSFTSLLGEINYSAYRCDWLVSLQLQTTLAGHVLDVAFVVRSSLDPRTRRALRGDWGRAGGATFPLAQIRLSGSTDNLWSTGASLRREYPPGLNRAKLQQLLKETLAAWNAYAESAAVVDAFYVRRLCERRTELQEQQMAFEHIIGRLGRQLHLAETMLQADDVIAAFTAGEDALFVSPLTLDPRDWRLVESLPSADEDKA